MSTWKWNKHHLQMTEHNKFVDIFQTTPHTDLEACCVIAPLSLNGKMSFVFIS
jgi:hypothetical protein